MAAPQLLDVIPTELIKRIMYFIYAEVDQDSFKAAMQTCRAMRKTCSGMISRLEVTSFGALRKFPRYSIVKTLAISLPGEAESVKWLECTLAASPNRLRHVEVVIFTLNSLYDDWGALSEALHLFSSACPEIKELNVSMDIKVEPFFEDLPLPGLIKVHLPSLVALHLSHCQLDENDFNPNLLPSGLQSLSLSSCVLGDKWAAHLAGMRNLCDLSISTFSLTSPLALPGSCAWRNVLIRDLAADYKKLPAMPLPMNWPLRALVSYGNLLSWHMDSADEARLAGEAAVRLSSLPIDPLMRLTLHLSGSHASAAALAPLSAFITTLRPPDPTPVLVAEISAHLSQVTKLHWPYDNSLKGDMALVAALLRQPRIADIRDMPDEAARIFAANVCHDVTISLKWDCDWSPQDFTDMVVEVTSMRRLGGILNHGTVTLSAACPSPDPSDPGIQFLKAAI